MRAGINMQPVAYHGQAPVISDLITARIALAFTSPAVPHINADKLRTLTEAGGVAVEISMKPEAIDAMIKSEVARRAKFMKEAGIEA